MLELIRYRRGRCDQNIQNKSDHHSDGFAETKALPLCADVVARLALLTKDPTTVLVLHGALQTAKAKAQQASSQIMTDDYSLLIRDVLADLRAECATYGSIHHVSANRKDLFVEFSRLDDAIIATASVPRVHLV